ncbi:cell wall-binding repeat-containing protein [Quadrisphaera sp. KR29]|uniref:cell wall-binding repeat-containing protein n=1 Tax=Quadrisphaera sp. KR29 TaxID=3461391 RepID=UPI0040445590
MGASGVLRAAGAVTCAVVLGALGAAAPPPAAAAAAAPERWWGPDRYATAAAVSREAFPGGADDVVVVSGASFPDALAAAPLAAHLGGPVLTVPAGALPPAVLTELARLRPARLHVVGGTTAVSADVVRQLQPLASGGVQRTQGGDRYETAAAVATGALGEASEVVLASGEGFPDALAGGSAAAALGAPLLLTRRDALPAPTRTALAGLAPTRVTVVGGPAVVSPAAVEQLRQLLPGAAVVRLAGDDRYGTAAAVARDTWESAPAPLLASGEVFPDALAGAALGEPLLLTRRECLPPATAGAWADLGVSAVTGLGGTAVLSDAALGATPCP